MNALPTGIYLPGASPLHRLSGLGKLICFFLLLAAVICTKTLPGYALLLLLTAALANLSKLPFQIVFSSVWRLKWFFLVIFLMNFCFYAPENPWLRLWIFTPSREGLVQGLQVAVRVLFALCLSNLLTATTAPMALTTAIEALLTPLKLVRIPVAQIAMILSVAIQFVPTLFEEADAIRKAQTARGARFDSRKLREKAGAALPLLVPIFLAAFQRADELSLAMEARGYRPKTARQGKLKLDFTRRDVLAIVLCAVILALILLF